MRKVLGSGSVAYLDHFLQYACCPILEVVALLEEMAKETLPFFFNLQQLSLAVLHVVLNLAGLTPDCLYPLFDLGYSLCTFIFHTLCSSPFLGFHQVYCVFLCDSMMLDFLE